MPMELEGYLSLAPVRRPRKRPRDSQRAKLYRAERCMEKWGEKYQDGSVQAAERFVKKVWESPWTRKHFPVTNMHAPPYIADGRGTRWAHGSLYRLNLPRWSRTRVVMLHEIAHSVTADRYAAHGRKYAANFLKLVQRWIGKEAAKQLRESFRKHGVKYKKKRKLSEEERQRLREQLSAVRAAAKQPSTNQN